jgi:CO/xanthine dehydrogenase FAD-binding subunit
LCTNEFAAGETRVPATYFAPRTLDEALILLDSENPVVLAGGTDVFPARDRAPLVDSFLDITRVADLRGLAWSEDGLRIGATTTWTDILRADLPAAFDALRAAAREVGSVQIQNSGTVAGNLCNASPAADGIPPLLTLDAEVELASSQGTRRLPLQDFVLGPRHTALRPGELCVALHLPRPPAHARSAFEKLGARKYLVISIAMTAVVIGLDREDRIDLARVAVGACSGVAQRLPALEAALLGQRPDRIDIAPDQWISRSQATGSPSC